MHVVPEPELCALPGDIRRLFPCVEDYASGTLIVWGKVDRNEPKRPTTIVDKTAWIAGGSTASFCRTAGSKFGCWRCRTAKQPPRTSTP